MPAAARQNTAAGAMAFTEFFFEQLNVAYTKPDAGLIPVLSSTACKSCTALQAGAVDLIAKGHRMKSGPVAPLQKLARSDASPPTETWVAFTLTQLDTPVIDRSGAVVERQKPSSVPKIASVVWEEDGWKMRGIANRS